MKKLVLLLLVCLVSLTQAALLSNEPFADTNYTVGDLDTQNPTVTGYTGAWTATDWGNQHVHYSSGSLGGGTGPVPGPGIASRSSSPSRPAGSSGTPRERTRAALPAASSTSIRQGTPGSASTCPAWVTVRAD